MEYIQEDEVQEIEGTSKNTRILCCECGVLISSNPANMCVACLRTHIDITEDIPKQSILYFCRNCERYLQPPSEWVSCSLESRELLALCLKRLKGLKELKLIDAGFIWTEPHSKRIKVKLIVQKEVFAGTMLQQVFIVEFIINNQMCTDCHRHEAKDYWRCVVQVRQRCENKKTFYYLEQLILKHKAHENTLGIKPEHGGLDFYYANENHARKLVDFLTNMLPVKSAESKRLISHDIHSNTYNSKLTFAVDIVPISKDSLVCLSKKLATQLGSISQLCLIARVANSVHLIDPRSGQIAELSSTMYYRQPFNSVCNPIQLREYIIMDIELNHNNDRKVFPGQGKLSHKHATADVWVVKSSELGKGDMIHTKTHLGHLLKTGDLVLCYDLRDANINDETYDQLQNVPDIILVKKHYSDIPNRTHVRKWKLKHLSEYDVDTNQKDYIDFLKDVEEDPQIRQNINIYRDPTKFNTDETPDADSVVDTQITLEEMLHDIGFSDVGMEEELK